MLRRLIVAVLPMLACAAVSAQSPGVVRTGNVSPIIESLDTSLGFYENLLHLQVPPNRGGGPRPFFQNPDLHKMLGTTGATERHVDARIPGTSMGIEMIEFHDVDRKAARPRLQDPGQVAIVLLVRNVDALLSRLMAAGVPVRTPGGKAVPVRDGARSVLVEDPDGRPVELRQLASLPASAPADGDIVGGRLAITVADLDKTVAVYRTALGFDVTAPTRFAVDPFVRTLSGVRGEVRRATATSPGTGQLFELTEFKSVERTPLQARLQDPGSVRLQMIVRGINDVAAAVTRAGGAIVSDGGVRASLPPNLWGITVRVPDNLYLSLLEPCGDCAPGRPTAVPPSGATASNVPPVPAISGPVSGPARMYPDPPVSVVPGSPQVEDFPYLAEEYFVTGTANDAPYTTRIILRRPKDPSRFSGTVAAEALHAGGRSLIFEWSRVSILTRRHLFVEIVHSPANIALLKAFNAERYAALAIAPGQTNEILAQVGRLVKSGAAPLAGYAIRQMTLMGTSASSGTVRNYFPAHAARRLPNGGPIFDGFLVTSTNGNEPLPIVDVPIVQMPTQTEVTTWAEAGIKYRRPDSDAPGNRYRLYEVAGMPHNNSRENPGFLNDPCTLPVTDFPAGAFTALGLNYLVDWIAKGAAPPHAPPIEVDQNPAGDGSFLALDEFGNAKGGIRNVYVDVPVAANGVMGKGKTTAQDRLCLLAGTKVPLKPEILQRLYKGKDDYVAKVDRRLKELVNAGWFLEEYADAVRADARKVVLP
ncbi:MAG TPA: alpha/beta hydrolase domain-containing protein [Vicinamibacterales bacterium]|jgi:catechol 2,3-dioxygenase-like lactoylglutathione lyase family enzyme|nr:alpha/beta hydrolase domain-containing protein [Vicinamibacterales bacterium]